MHGRTTPPPRHAPRNGRNPHDQRRRDSAASQGLCGHRARESAAGDPGRGGRRCGGAHPAGSQGGRASGGAGRAGPALQPDHRFRHAGHRPWAACARPQHGHGRLRQGLRVRRRRQADRLCRPTGDLPGLPPPGRAGGDAQLHWHPDLGELQRPRGWAGGRRFQASPLHRLRAAAGLSERGRSGRADTQDRLRHGCGRAAATASPHACRLCASPEFLARHRARPRLRGESDRRAAA